MSQPSQVENAPIKSDYVYVGINGRVRALNITAGTVRTLWTSKLHRDYMVHLILHNNSNRIYAANSGHVFCIDSITGKTIWKEKPHHSGQFVSLFLSADGAMLVSACYGTITAFNAANAGGSYILAEQNGVLFMGNNGHVWAINLQRGFLLWKNKLKGSGFCPIAMATYGNKLYVGTAGYILSLDSRTGSTLNSYTIKSTGYNPVTLLIDYPSNLLFAAVSSKLLCFKADNLTELWKSSLLGIGNSSGYSLLSSDAESIAIGMNGKIALLKKCSGEVVWQKCLPMCGYELVTVATMENPDILICATNGKIYGVDKNGNLIWKDDLPHLGYGEICISTTTFNTDFNSTTLPQYIEEELKNKSHSSSSSSSSSSITHHAMGSAGH